MSITEIKENIVKTLSYKDHLDFDELARKTGQVKEVKIEVTEEFREAVYQLISNNEIQFDKNWKLYIN